jgi:SAM-dependent methyltransferase
MQKSALSKEDIVANGCFSPEENTRIYEKWFKPGPRRRAMHAMKKYGLTTDSVLDVGSAYGNNLRFLGPGSYGVEIEPAYVEFSNSIGLKAYVRDVSKNDLTDFPKVNNAIAWAVMEHVDSQHNFLRNVASVLNDNGRLFLYVPTIPLAIPRFLPKRLQRYWQGHLHGDHINAYTARTLRFICERAGFETVACNPGFHGFWSFLNCVPMISDLFDGVLYVGRKIPDWQYPSSSTRK